MRNARLAGAVLMAVVSAVAAAFVIPVPRQDSRTAQPAVDPPAGREPPEEEEIVPFESILEEEEEERAATLLSPEARPPERPDARLTLRMTDEVTGEPVAVRASLWRLGVPEDEKWTEGDVKVASFRILVEGVFLEDLVPGRYRVACTGLRKGADDPPEFQVRSGENEFEAAVRMPRTFNIHLRMFDEEGRSIDRAVRQTVITTRQTDHPSDPRWVEPRWRKLPDGSLEGIQIWAGSGRG